MKTLHASLFFTGFLQVLFVSANGYMISKAEFAWVLVFGFLISLIWSWNVKRIAFGTWKDRIVYALGASLGSVAGLKVSTLILGAK